MLEEFDISNILILYAHGVENGDAIEDVTIDLQNYILKKEKEIE